ncbi:MAG: hypothetical protein JO312_15305 [Hyphomicrobiales bacterium]|nr:hypothetical protein [Hyphomicrobiales bacterium]
MRTAARLLVCSFFLTFAARPVEIARAAEAIMLRAGEATGPNAVFAFDNAKPHRIVVRTTQVGVAGSRIEVFVDKAKTPAFRHLFDAAECKFGDNGSKCQVVVPASDPAYAAILAQFKRGRVARVAVDDAGAMKMDETASLKGFTKSLR